MGIIGEWGIKWVYTVSTKIYPLVWPQPALPIGIVGPVQCDRLPQIWTKFVEDSPIFSTPPHPILASFPAWILAVLGFWQGGHVFAWIRAIQHRWPFPPKLCIREWPFHAHFVQRLCRCLPLGFELSWGRKIFWMKCFFLFKIFGLNAWRLLTNIIWVFQLFSQSKYNN